MKQAFILLMFGVLLMHHSQSLSEPIRSGNIAKKSWNGRGITTPGELKIAPNTNDCNRSEYVIFGDKLLTFDISRFRKLSGAGIFDPNRIHVDAIGSGGQSALSKWLENWNKHIGSYSLPPIEGLDWNGKDVISVCVGSEVLFNTFDSNLQSIILWYDAPVVTVEDCHPRDRCMGDKINLTKPADILLTTNSGVKTFHFNGPGSPVKETESPATGKPDFITNKVWLTNINGVEQYAYNLVDQITINAEFKNKGDLGIPKSSYIYSRFYLSKGLKEDSHSSWIRIGTEQTLGSNLEVGEAHQEHDELKPWTLSAIQPGKTYNFVVCIDRIADSGNGSGDWLEKHESNNCSTEAVFAINGIFNFNMATLALGGNKTILTAGEAYTINASTNNVSNNSPTELRVGYFLSGPTIQGEQLLGTHLVTETEFVSGFTKPLNLSGLNAPSVAGVYTLKACIDYDERTFETNENDNCLYKNFTVTTPAVLSPAPKKTKVAVLHTLFNN